MQSVGEKAMGKGEGKGGDREGKREREKELGQVYIME